MSKRFGALKADITAKSRPVRAKAEVAPDVAVTSDPTSTKAKAREGKKAVVGYFSEDLSRQLRMMSIEEGTTVQALIGEAIDMLMRARGKHSFGER